MNADRMEDVIRRRLVVDERSLKRLAKRAVDIGGVLPPTDTDADASTDGAAAGAASYDDFQIEAAAFRSSLRRLHHQLLAQAADQAALADERVSIDAELSAARSQVSGLHDTLASERKARSARRSFDRAVRDLQRTNLPTRADGERGLKALRADIKAAKLAKGNLQRAWTRRERLFRPVLHAVRQYGEESVRDPTAASEDADGAKDDDAVDEDAEVDDDAEGVDAGGEDEAAESTAGTVDGDAAQEHEQTSTPAQAEVDKNEDVAMSDAEAT